MCFNRNFMLRAFLAFVTLFSLQAVANENIIAAQIIDRTVNSIFNGKRINTWGETPAHRQIIEYSTKMEATDDPNTAQFLIISTNMPKNIAKNSILFTTNYELFTKNEQIMGAFYWRKGRPNLLFLRDRLKKADVTLGKEFDKYIEDNL